MYKAIPKRFNLPSLLVPTLWLVPLIVAVLGTVTRSSDDVHHGFDIVAGGLLGLIFTLLVTLLLLKPHEVRERAPLCRVCGRLLTPTPPFRLTSPTLTAPSRTLARRAMLKAASSCHCKERALVLVPPTSRAYLAMVVLQHHYFYRCAHPTPCSTTKLPRFNLRLYRPLLPFE